MAHDGIGYIEETWTARFLRDQRIVSIGGDADEVTLRVLSTMDGFTGWTDDTPEAGSAGVRKGSDEYVACRQVR